MLEMTVLNVALHVRNVESNLMIYDDGHCLSVFEIELFIDWVGNMLKVYYGLKGVKKKISKSSDFRFKCKYFLISLVWQWTEYVLAVDKTSHLRTLGQFMD